ncbi:MAG: FecR domain-containing protein, partial [Spirochaetota bacterium]
MKPQIRLFLIIILLVVFIPLMVKAEDEEDEVGTITLIQGACQIKSEDGEYKDAILDQKVYSKDTIKTFEGSEAEIMLFDGSVIRITEDSETTLDAWQIRENRYTNIGLIFGSIKLFVKRFSKDTDEFSVNTATVTAGVRGTEFDVSIREDGEVLINVEEGEIETEVDGERHTI